MIDEDLPLSRKLKLLMGLIYATDFITSTVSNCDAGCTLSKPECEARKTALASFRSRILRIYTNIATSNLCHQQSLKQAVSRQNYEDNIGPHLARQTIEKSWRNFPGESYHEHFRMANSENKRYPKFSGTKGGNPAEKEIREETNKNSEKKKDCPAILSSNPSSYESDSEARTFEALAEIHNTSQYEEGRSDRIGLRNSDPKNIVDHDKSSSARSNSSLNEEEIEIDNNVLSATEIAQRLKEKKEKQGAKFICAFPSCKSAYTRKMKLQSHLSVKHGLEKEDQIRFYECIPEASIDLSPSKPGPKTYIPPRFQCPTTGCKSKFSRKYDLLKHLKRCNVELIDSPDVQNLKDSVIQHCKGCDQVIKGGHLAKHKIICNCFRY